VYRLWVDDVRRPPSDEWVWVKHVDDAIEQLQAGHWHNMSLDHDLGGDETSRQIVLWLCENPEYWPTTVVVHSANPVGKEWLEGTIERYKP
jgi:hypothetical protein